MPHLPIPDPCDTASYPALETQLCIVTSSNISWPEATTPQSAGSIAKDNKGSDGPLSAIANATRHGCSASRPVSAVVAVSSHRPLLDLLGSSSRRHRLPPDYRQGSAVTAGPGCPKFRQINRVIFPICFGIGELTWSPRVFTTPRLRLWFSRAGAYKVIL